MCLWCSTLCFHHCVCRFRVFALAPLYLPVPMSPYLTRPTPAPRLQRRRSASGGCHAHVSQSGYCISFPLHPHWPSSFCSSESHILKAGSDLIMFVMKGQKVLITQSAHFKEGKSDVSTLIMFFFSVQNLSHARNGSHTLQLLHLTDSKQITIWSEYYKIIQWYQK